MIFGKRFNNVVWLIISFISSTFIVKKIILLYSSNEILKTVFNISKIPNIVSFLEDTCIAILSIVTWQTLWDGIRICIKILFCSSI
jgi:hypothetical protein